MPESGNEETNLPRGRRGRLAFVSGRAGRRAMPARPSPDPGRRFSPDAFVKRPLSHLPVRNASRPNVFSVQKTRRKMGELRRVHWHEFEILPIARHNHGRPQTSKTDRLIPFPAFSAIAPYSNFCAAAYFQPSPNVLDRMDQPPDADDMTRIHSARARRCGASPSYKPDGTPSGSRANAYRAGARPIAGRRCNHRRA
jgi:hypothetical protein